MNIVRSKQISNLKQEYVSDIRDYDATYVIPKSVLKVVGIRLTCQDSNFARIAWNVFYYFEFINLFIGLCLEIINMALTAQGGSFQDAVQIFRTMPCIGFILLALTKSFPIVYHRPVYENLVKELRDMWPQGTVTQEEHNIINTSVKRINYVTKGYYWCNVGLMVVFTSPPIVQVLMRYAGKDVPLIPFFYWFPFDSMQPIIYEIILTVQTWHCLICVWCILSGDLFFCVFLGHITTQFDLLAAKIRNLVHVPVDAQLIPTYPLGMTGDKFRNRNETETENFEINQHEALTAVIRRHLALIRLSGDVEDKFTFSLLVNFLNGTVIICFCGFCSVVVEQWNEIVYKFFLITTISQMWLLCWFGQLLLDSSENISATLYTCGWYNTSVKIRKCILIMLHRAQKNVHVTTYRFSVISLSSFTVIIKTSWSYFTLLINMYNR